MLAKGPVIPVSPDLKPQFPELVTSYAPMTVTVKSNQK